MKRKKQKHKIHIKNGDIIKIISGNNKGKIGEVIKVITQKQHVIIKNINLKTKHIRPKKENDSGQIIQIEHPIHSSNVMLYSAKEKIASRYNKIIDKNKVKQRILKKTGEII
uniref:Large ribosomal subunit protein uL24c n=1 Tax=Riquetophycus sp. TaxID=1897556 RepID=A0A1C9C8G0_9FLOR|nr:ribosomal protein L24 [Riquetophycus sp.]